MKAEQVITELFDLGGVIAGGFATSYLFNSKQSVKDYDFFFNDLEKFEIAQKHRSYRFDIVHYETPEPYSTFDLSVSRCYLDRNGKLSISQECLETYHSGIIRVHRDCLFNPYGTLRRIAKYKGKFGLKIDPDDMAYVRKVVNERVYKISS